MKRTGTSSFVRERDIFIAMQHFGQGTGPSLAQRERHRRAIAEAERARVLLQNETQVAAGQVPHGLRSALGGVLVRIGLRLQGVAPAATAVAPR